MPRYAEFDYIGIHQSEVMMSGNPEGIDKVEDSNGKYAFFVESSIIEYLVERRVTHCRYLYHQGAQKRTLAVLSVTPHHFILRSNNRNRVTSSSG